MIVDQSIRDLHIILVTERCDMSYVISYFTQENVFIVAEIVFQSSCKSHWAKLEPVKLRYRTSYSIEYFPIMINTQGQYSFDIKNLLTLISM